MTTEQKESLGTLNKLLNEVWARRITIEQGLEYLCRKYNEKSIKLPKELWDKKHYVLCGIKAGWTNQKIMERYGVSYIYIMKIKKKIESDRQKRIAERDGK